MIRKSLITVSSIKVKTNLGESKAICNKDKLPKEDPQKINNCLNCKKPIEECKGNCYGRL